MSTKIEIQNHQNHNSHKSTYDPKVENEIIAYLSERIYPLTTKLQMSLDMASISFSSPKSLVFLFSKFFLSLSTSLSLWNKMNELFNLVFS